MVNKLAIAVLILGLSLLASCAQPSRFGAVETSLNDDIGKLTYPEAVTRWGKPTSLSEGKEYFTAYWFKERSAGLIKERLYLTFDNQKQILRAFRYTSKPFD